MVIAHKQPTKEMWIDVNTKPKQGTPFKIDRSLLMNCPVNIPDETLLWDPSSQLPFGTLGSNEAPMETAGVCWRCPIIGASGTQLDTINPGRSVTTWVESKPQDIEDPEADIELPRGDGIAAIAMITP